MILNLTNLIFILLAATILSIGILLLMWRKIKMLRIEIDSKKLILFEDQSEKQLVADPSDSDAAVINMALNIIQKNEMLEQVRNRVLKISSSPDLNTCRSDVDDINSLINKTLQIDKDRDVFELFIEEQNKIFYTRLTKKFQNLTKNEQRLAALIRLNLSSKEIADLLNISTKSVEMNRYRLRKKLQIDRETNLAAFLDKI